MSELKQDIDKSENIVFVLNGEVFNPPLSHGFGGDVKRFIIFLRKSVCDVGASYEYERGFDTLHQAKEYEMEIKLYNDDSTFAYSYIIDLNTGDKA